MKLKFRTLRGEPFEITINESTSVKSIKEMLKNQFDLVPNNIRLINGIKILADTTIVDPNSFNFNGFIVIHEDDQSLRENITIPSNIKTSFSILRTNSEPSSNKDVIQSLRHHRPLKNGKRTNFNNQSIDEQFEQSSDFQEILKSFTTMGFDQEKSLQYLRRFNYDYDAVINFFITGVMPSEEIEEEYEEEEEKVQKVEPKPKPKPREYDVSGLRSYNFGMFSNNVQQLTNTEKYALLRVLREHRNLEIDFITQIFFSCSNDYTTTTHFLEENNM
ncbi:hypothetical protein M9Y10_004461 [Tritrichomonas musculus]|uniref:UBA domain-containing protein n=1 Tax=Tritrichomonas musculus TaxID=1915356 RepID=A0ABR2JSG3_9EUKA